MKPKLNVTPAQALRFVVLICLWFYHDIVTNPSPRSINTYYEANYPIIGEFITILFPPLFIIGIALIVAFGKTYPFRVILIGAMPQFMYTILSAGWYWGLYPDINRAALYIHVIVSAFILLIAWLGVQNANPSPN